MKPKLILHIGAHRTATTALQAHLQKNSAVLKDKGYLYPFKVRRHLKLMNDLFSGRRSVTEVSDTLMTRIAAQDKDIHTVILSDEDICTRPDLSLFADFQKNFDMKIAFTLRRQDTWLESWFFQNLKWQWNRSLSHCTFKEFMPQRNKFHWIHYERYIQHLERLFGHENLILNIYEKDQMPNGPVVSFLNSVGLTDQSGLSDAQHINNRFSPQVTEFMRQLPLDEAPVAYRDVLAKACSRMDAQRQKSQSRPSELMLTHRERVSLLKEYETGNATIARKYFNRDQLFFDPLPGPKAPLADMSLPGNTDALMAEMVAPFVRELIAHFKENN